LVGDDGFVRQQQPTPLASPHQTFDVVHQKLSGRGRVIYLSGSFKIVPGDLDRVLNWDG
jgi:hypothetical protein